MRMQGVAAISLFQNNVYTCIVRIQRLNLEMIHRIDKQISFSVFLKSLTINEAAVIFQNISLNGMYKTNKYFRTEKK